MKKKSPLKEKVRNALLAMDFDKIARLCLDDRKVFSVLISFTYDKEDLLCWRAIESLGRAAGAIAGEDSSWVRNVVQRLLWSLRDESGGIAWSAPEMLGEIVIYNPVTCSDIPPILLSFREEENFLRGVLWALGRIIHSRKIDVDNIDGVFDLILNSLRHEDPAVRGLAAYAASGIIEARCKCETSGTDRGIEIRQRIRDMAGDTGKFRLYRDHELMEMTVGDAAREAMEC